MLARPRRARKLRAQSGLILLVLAACGLGALFGYSRHIRRVNPLHKAPAAIRHSAWRGLRHFDMGYFGRTQTAWSCPLVYQRTSYEEIRRRERRPYLLGGPQRPKCANCDRAGELWSEFCQFKSHGPACTQWDQWRLLDALLRRAEAGAHGAVALLTLTPCDLFELLEGRTLWLLGDSMTQELQRALQCFFYEFWELETHELFELLVDSDNPPALPSGWCVFMLRGTKICHVRSNYGETLAKEAFPSLARLGAAPSDIAVFNFGAWHNDAGTFRGNASAAAAYLARERSALPFLVWREVAPQHFDTPLGEYGCDGCPTPDAPYRCQAVQGVSLNGRNELESSVASKRILVEGGWRNRETAALMAGLGIPTLAIWNVSMPLWEYHHNFQPKDDCTHMCHPSAYQVWIYRLYELLLDVRWQIPPIGSVGT